MALRVPKGYISESDPRVSQIGHAAPVWLVNYADLMTELVCFFIILYALSAALNKNVQSAARQVRDMIDKKEISGDVKVDREGLKITLDEQGKNVFFQSGSAELTPEMERLTDKIAPILRKLVAQHDIIVEGHTDNIPIRNDLYRNNWELSTSRATNLVEYLIRVEGFPPGKMAAMGYGEFRPIVPNDTVEHRDKNRRVVFFVKNTAGGSSASTVPASPAAAATSPMPAGQASGTSSGSSGAAGLLQGLLSRFRGK